MAEYIPEDMQQEVVALLKQMMDKPEFKISRVADQWWEFKDENGGLIAKLFDKPTWGEDVSLELLGKKYSLPVVVTERLVEYAWKALIKHQTREYVDRLNSVLSEINKYGKNPNFEDFKITAYDAEAINKAVEAVVINLIHGPYIPVEDIIIGDQLIEIRTGKKVLMSINLKPYMNDPSVKLMGKEGTVGVHLNLDAAERIKKAIQNEVLSRRYKNGAAELGGILESLRSRITPRGNNSEERR